MPYQLSDVPPCFLLCLTSFLMCLPVFCCSFLHVPPSFLMCFPVFWCTLPVFWLVQVEIEMNASHIMWLLKHLPSKQWLQDIVCWPVKALLIYIYIYIINDCKALCVELMHLPRLLLHVIFEVSVQVCSYRFSKRCNGWLVVKQKFIVWIMPGGGGGGGFSETIDYLEAASPECMKLTKGRFTICLSIH